MMYSAYKLNKQGDNIQPWHTTFPIWNQSIVPCSVLTVASWPTYRFLRRWVRWTGIPISFRIFHSLFWSTVKGFGIVNKAEVDVFLEFSYFFNDPTDVGNLFSSFRLLSVWQSLGPSTSLQIRPECSSCSSVGISASAHDGSLYAQILGFTKVWEKWASPGNFQGCGQERAEGMNVEWQRREGKNRVDIKLEETRCFSFSS